MRLLALGCIVFVMGAWFGFYEAHAASGVKITGYLTGKEVPKYTDAFVNGYAAGNFDMLGMVVWMANDQPKYFTPEYFTKQYQCLQKIPSTQETVAWAKAYWSKEPDVWAAEEITWNACDYAVSSSRTSTVTKTRSPAPSSAGKQILIK